MKSNDGDLCPTCGGGVFPGRELTSCPDVFHGREETRELPAGVQIKRLTKALRNMVTIVEMVEAFPAIVATNTGLDKKGRKWLKEAQALLRKLE